MCFTVLKNIDSYLELVKSKIKPHLATLIQTDDDELIEYKLSKKIPNEYLKFNSNFTIDHNFNNIEMWEKIMQKVTTSLDLSYLLIDFLDEKYYFPFLPLLVPWVGIFHYSTKTELKNCIDILDELEFLLSLDWCKCLLFLSHHLMEEWKIILQRKSEEYKFKIPPLKVISHPFIEYPIKYSKRQHQLIHPGNFYRDKRKFWDFPHFSKLEIKRLSYNDYLNFIQDKIIFSYYLDLSASVLILEAIHYNIPIIVNKHPAAIEYLGEDYPLYYDDIIELALSEILVRLDISEDYLKNLDKTKFQIEVFYQHLLQL